MELESRLIKSENLFYAQYLLPRVIGNITNEQIATLYETYQTDLTCNVRRIQEGGRSKANTLEYNTSRSDANFTLWDTWCGKPGAISFYRYHLVYHVDNAGNKCYRRAIVQCTTSVRSTMNNDRLPSLALMHIHRDFSVDLDKVMEKFVSAKTRRTDFGKF